MSKLDKIIDDWTREIIHDIVKPILKQLVQEKENNTIHITKHSGKLTGIDSINTNSLENIFCVNMSKNPKTICSKCYANTLIKLRKQLKDKLSFNSKLLSSKVLEMRDLPLINALYFRFQSFGDLINLNHLENLYNIAIKNPKVTFALWTKRDKAVQLFGLYKKPDNVILIYSNPFIDKPLYRIPEGFDKVFSVYSDDYIKENDIKINCGAKNCLSCHKCYEFNEIRIINERLK